MLGYLPYWVGGRSALPTAAQSSIQTTTNIYWRAPPVIYMRDMANEYYAIKKKTFHEPD